MSDSVVCLFVLPLQGRISLFLYFVNGLLYNIRNIKFLPSWVPSIPPPGNYSSLLDSCTPYKTSLGLSLVAVVGSSTGWISCLNIMQRGILKTGCRCLSVAQLAQK